LPYIVNHGVRLYWEAHGSGPPVLLIMGLRYTHEMWFRVLPRLLQAGYRAILFDNRGVGRSECPRGPYSIRGMAKDAAAVLDAAGVDAAHVAGASMGGMIAQELTLECPHRVRTLMLACTSYSGLLGKKPHWRYCPNPFTWSRLPSDERERTMKRLLYAETTPAERVEEDLAVRSNCVSTSRGLYAQFTAILLWSSYRRLPRINVPTLVLHGADDHLLPPENGRRIAARIPGARFHLLPNAGHLLTTDQPGLTVQLFLDFLKETG